MTGLRFFDIWSALMWLALGIAFALKGWSLVAFGCGVLFGMKMTWLITGPLRAAIKELDEEIGR